MKRLWPPWLVRPRLAVVLGGGATLGAFEVGVIDVLARRAIVPDMLIGTSAGAINAAYWAFDHSVAAGERLLKFWLEANRFTMVPDGALPMFGRFMQGRDHLTTQSGLRRLLLRALPEDAVIESAAIPLAIVATDAETGSREALRRGPLHQAVLASSAIPGLFPAVQVGDHKFVDGGISANCDIETAAVMGATDVIVVDVIGDGPLTATFSVANVIERSLGIVLRKQISWLRFSNGEHESPFCVRSLPCGHTPGTFASRRFYLNGDARPLAPSSSAITEPIAPSGQGCSCSLRPRPATPNKLRPPVMQACCRPALDRARPDSSRCT